jgi:putative selenium metabolism protein SsnA
MAIVLQNALLADIDPIRVERAELRLSGGTIEQRRANVRSEPGDELIDCRGAVVLPGLVNGHTHLYSALATGMPPPPRVPQNFLDILQLVWWRLDRALDAESIEASALIDAIEAIRCGTTTLIDHHASPSEILNSLDLVERGLASAGVRGVLCYEVTDRHGKDGREAGLKENRRFHKKCSQGMAGAFAALSGAHASFTLEELSLQGVVHGADEFKTGVHIHVAEDPIDEQITRNKFGTSLIDRLATHGLLQPNHIFAHGTHLSDEAIRLINDAGGPTFAHNPRSNMNNAVGYSPIGKLEVPIMLGTDGIGADLFAEAKFAWFKSRDAYAAISPARVIDMLASSARRASQALRITLGQLQPGAAGDVVVTDYIPSTPLTTDNFPGHFLFAMDSRHVKHVLIGGEWAMRDRILTRCDEVDIRHRCTDVAARMWRRMDSIKP